MYMYMYMQQQLVVVVVVAGGEQNWFYDNVNVPFLAHFPSQMATVHVKYMLGVVIIKPRRECNQALWYFLLLFIWNLMYIWLGMYMYMYMYVHVR